jgi:hypothetical protein
VDKNNLELGLSLMKQLIENKEISSNHTLYRTYRNDQNLREAIGVLERELDFEVVVGEHALYFSPGMSNKLWGYTNERLRHKLEVSNNSELYMQLFAILCLVAMFYSSNTVEHEMRSFLPVSEWEKYITEKAMSIKDYEHTQLASDDLEIRFDVAANYWLDIKDHKFNAIEHARTKDNRVAILLKLAKVMSDEGLLNVHEEKDYNIYLTEKFKALFKNTYSMQQRKQEILDFIKNELGGGEIVAKD